MDILVDQWWRIDRALTLEDTYQSGKVAKIVFATALQLSLIIMLVTENYREFNLSNAADELGIRTCLCYEVSDRDGEQKCGKQFKKMPPLLKPVP